MEPRQPAGDELQLYLVEAGQELAHPRAHRRELLGRRHPVGRVLRGALRHPGLGLRGVAGVLTAVYATPFALWLLDPDRAQSLSKDIHPGFVTLIVAASAAVLLTLRARR